MSAMLPGLFSSVKFCKVEQDDNKVERKIKNRILVLLRLSTKTPPNAKLILI
jgi:hypothetical protein